MKNGLIFLDIDGVLTAKDDGTSYLVVKSSEDYKLSEKCLKNLRRLIDETGASIVLSTNWTRFEAAGVENWPYNGMNIYSQLPKLRKMFKDKIVGMIPPIKGLEKSFRTILWFEENNYGVDFDKYVIFDDDLREGFQKTTDYGIYKHFIHTDEETGLSEKDVEIARKFLV